MENNFEEEVPRIIFRYPTLRERFIGVILDNATIFLFFLIVSYISTNIVEIGTTIKTFIFIGLLLFYEPLMTKYYCTVGQLLMGFRIRKNDNEEIQISLLQAFGRLFLKYLLGWLSFLTVTFNQKNRAIHDLASGTIALNVEVLKK